MSARLLVLLLCGAFTACSSFESRWRAAEKGAGLHSTTRWDGRWTSEKHAAPLGGGPAGGRLRCVLGEVTAATNCVPTEQRMKSGRQTHLRADFRANWMIFASGYTMTLIPVPGSRTEFRGTHELPAIFGGTYRYTARIAGDRFSARYDSRYDRGTFDLTRVRP